MLAQPKSSDSDRSAQLRLRLIERSFRQNYVALVWYATRITHDVDVAEDCVQTVFLKILGNETAWDVVSAGYLFKATRNEALRHIQRRDRFIPLVNSAVSEAVFKLQVDDSLIDEKQADSWANALATLPKCCGAIVTLRLQGKSYKLIANELGISARTVDNQLQRAKKLLRRSFL